MSRRLPKVEPWKAEFVDEKLKVKPKTYTPKEDLTVDALMDRVLRLVDMTLDGCEQEVLATYGVMSPPRECIMSIKDCHAILGDMKKREAELLASLSDSDLEKLKNS